MVILLSYLGVICAFSTYYPKQADLREPADNNLNLDIAKRVYRIFKKQGLVMDDIRPSDFREFFFGNLGRRQPSSFRTDFSRGSRMRYGR